jgi:hypothetical protein
LTRLAVDLLSFDSFRNWRATTKMKALACFSRASCAGMYSLLFGSEQRRALRKSEWNFGKMNQRGLGERGKFRKTKGRT